MRACTARGRERGTRCEILVVENSRIDVPLSSRAARTRWMREIMMTNVLSWLYATNSNVFSLESGG